MDVMGMVRSGVSGMVVQGKDFGVIPLLIACIFLITSSRMGPPDRSTEPGTFLSRTGRACSSPSNPIRLILYVTTAMALKPDGDFKPKALEVLLTDPKDDEIIVKTMAIGLWIALLTMPWVGRLMIDMITMSVARPFAIHSRACSKHMRSEKDVDRRFSEKWRRT